MILLDLFCKAGGAARGYANAGFDIVGIDTEPQPHYPYEFIQADAIEYVTQHGYKFNAIHASPPCQHYSILSQNIKNRTGKVYPDLVVPTRNALIASGKPYVIENVVGAPLINPIILQGDMFGLRVIKRRLFEINFEVPQPPLIYRPGKDKPGFYMNFATSPGSKLKFGKPFKKYRGSLKGIAATRAAHGIDWPMNDSEANNAIPPPYTHYIGLHLMNHINNNVK